MRPAIFLLTAALLHADAGAGAANKAERLPDDILVVPSDARYFTPAAVDHVAVMEVAPDGGPSRDVAIKIVVTRSGPWLREETPGRVTFSNIDSGMSYAVERSSDGRNRRMSMTGPHRATKLTIERTGENRRILGERCTIWLFRHEQSYLERNCITADGIMLSSSAETKDGYVLSSSRAVSFLRRRVTPKEVEPPASLFALASWPVWTPPAKTGPNDEVLLEGTEPDGTGRQRPRLLIRRFGPYVMTDERDHRNRRRIYERADFRIDAIDRLDGTLDWFGAAVIAPKDRADLLPTLKPIQTGKADTILGRPCRYFDLAPGVADFGQIECRTDDGLILRRTTSNRGSTLTVTAVKVTIGSVALRDVAPPATIFSAYR